MDLQELKTNLRKIAPWNWFRKEQERQAASGLGAFRAPTVATNPFASSPLWQLHREVDRLFEEAFRGFGWPFPATTGGSDGAIALRPALDIEETAQAYRVTVEVPGVEERDLELSLDGDVLVIRGEKRREREQTEGGFHRIERAYGSFERLLDLPEDADPEAISARFRNGVLTITIGRRQPQRGTKGRSIPIEG